VSELTARGLAYAGVELEGYSGRATMMRVQGVQIAVLAYSYGLSGDSEEKTKEDSRGVLAKMSTKRMIDDITRARVEGANLVVVLPHWGTKNKLETADTVRYTARTLAEAGADVILGTHPNVPQGTEILTVTRSDGLTYRTAVCYSLGNLLTDARTRENTTGMIAHVIVTYDPLTRRMTLDTLYCTPVYIARQKEDGETVYRVVDAESQKALSLLTQSEQEKAGEAAEMIRSIAGEEGQG
ncbi:MAG: CapA family protein, partial [Clostridia bacterium]|nr:CapA family protein [Clostridia bacterium]